MTESASNTIQPAELLKLIEKAIDLNQQYFEALGEILSAVAYLKSNRPGEQPLHWYGEIIGFQTASYNDNAALQRMDKVLQADVEKGVSYVRLTSEEIKANRDKFFKDVEDIGF